MSRNCPCGGKFQRSDLITKWSPLHKRMMTWDTDPLKANWKCGKCGAVRTQRKRQPKNSTERV